MDAFEFNGNMYERKYNAKEVRFKVTNINGRYHTRLFDPDNKLHSEMACDEKQDIGFVCYELARWYDKMGGDSKMCSHCRDRSHIQPIGKVYWPKDLPIEKGR